MPPPNIIYPLFLAQAGCPFACVYCNQRLLTGTTRGSRVPWEERIREFAETAIRQERPGEIAFYGGTFTMLADRVMNRLLDAASGWIEAGAFTGIRFSTRPDGISAEIVGTLKNFPVSTIELGVQSLSDPVLEASMRGYTEARVRQAVALLRESEWRLGIQLMVGLPGDSGPRFQHTIKATRALAPDLVRLYPTLVLTGTLLAQWYARGRYQPLSLEQALTRCCNAYDAFRQSGIRVARMGLHADRQLDRDGCVLAGPHHPAFGYLVKVTWWRWRIAKALAEGQGTEKVAVVWVPARQLSEVVGPNRNNVRQLQQVFRLKRLEICADADCPADGFRLELEKG